MSTDPKAPITYTYTPKTEYRLSRDIFSFEELGGTVTSTIDSSYPFVTQQIGNNVYAELGNPDGTLLGNFAYVVDGRWYITHDYSAHPTLNGSGGLITVNIGPVTEVGKGDFSNVVSTANIHGGSQASTVVARYQFPTQVGTTIQLKRVNITRTYSGGAYVYSESIELIAERMDALNDADFDVRYNMASSRIANGTFLLSIARKFPIVPQWEGVGLPTEKWNEHIHIEFWKITNVNVLGSEVWTKLTPFISLPTDDTEFTRSGEGSVDTTQWTLFCFSAPYDGPGLIYNNGGSAKSGLGMTITVFNSDRNGKASYFVEKDGFCSEIKDIVPVYNDSQPDFVSGLGTTSFKPTSLVQVGTRRDSQWSGVYLTGNFTRTADDGVSVQINCYLRGNSLLTNSDSLGSGVHTGAFGWTFGARNFYLGSDQGQVVFPSPAGSMWSLEFDFESSWVGPIAYPTAEIGYEFETWTPYWHAFGVDGSVFRANMSASQLKYPRWVSASDIVSWNFQEATDSASTLAIEIPRSSQAKFQSGNTISLRYWSTSESVGTTAGTNIGSFIIEEESYSTESGLDSTVTIQCMDVASSIINNWSSPIDMFFDPKFSTPQDGNRNINAVPSLKYLIEKTPSRDNSYEWTTTGYSHWGINKPAILFNHVPSSSKNPLNKHRIKFGTSVDNNIGIQAFGSLFAAYNDGTMAGAFLTQAPASGNSRAIFAQSNNTRSTPTLDTGAHSLRIVNGTTVTNRVTIMGGRLKANTDPDISSWEIPLGGRSLVGVNGLQTIPDATFYRTKVDDTIFGASNDSIYGYQRIAGGGTYLYESNATLTQGVLYDFAVKVFGDSVLVWYKPVQYEQSGADAPASGTNLWTLLTYYRASPKYDTWMRPEQKKYTGVALSTDAWFTANESFPDAEIGRNTLKFNKTESPATVGVSGYRLSNDPYDGTTLGFDPQNTSGSTGYPYTVTSWGAQYNMAGTVFSSRYWDVVGSRAQSITAGMDVVNASPSYTGSPTSSNWSYMAVPNILVRKTTITASNMADDIGLPYRAVDVPPVITTHGRSGYIIINDEVVRWREDYAPRSPKRLGNQSTEAAAIGDYYIAIPTDMLAVKKDAGGETVYHSPEKLSFGTWRFGQGFWYGYWGNPFMVPHGGTMGADVWLSTLNTTNGTTLTYTDNYTNNSSQNKAYYLPNGSYFQIADSGFLTTTTNVDRNKEIMRVVSSSYNAGTGVTTFTIARGQLGTTATTHAGDKDLWFIPPSGYAGSPGQGKNAHLEVLTPYGYQGSSSEYHVIDRTYGGGNQYEYETVAEEIKATPSESDVAVVSGRAQLGTTKGAHLIGDYISAYPVANAEAAYFPADYDANSATGDSGFSAYAIKNSVNLLRNTSYSGAYRSVRDSLYLTTALTGARSVFREAFSEITGSYVDTLQSLFTTNNWSITLQARKWIDVNANFKSAIIRFRTGSAYYLTIDSWTGGANRTWIGDAAIRAINLKLSYGTEDSNVLEQVSIPLMGHLATTALTAPIVVSLSGDTLSVDCMDEQLWSFDLASYANTSGNSFRSTAPSTVAIKTADTQTACYWYASELGDEVESTVVDRGSEFNSALSFLLNGRWVKNIISREGHMQHGRFLTRRYPFDFYTAGASTVRSRYLMTTQTSENPHIAAGHVESSGATFAEIVDENWIRANGYVFKESQNRLILTASDARLESRLRIRAEKEANERVTISGHLAPTAQPEDAFSWNSTDALDYVIEAHAMQVTQAQAISQISSRKYYAI